ncbi:uncharacterized protein LOC100191760 [Zea mays]|uniref:uncharacterized protein LOC100191760 n=1 Tax=Zea mays TaxID=4577 RepID=UPI0015C662A3|nr:uncharacterized protein LOC100191760 [Zea mays]
MSNTLLRVYPSDLKMPFELRKQNSACLELVNKTDRWVAFKVKTTNPRKYSVRSASGVVPPRGSCGITITMQAPKEMPPDYHCKDKFLVQSIAVEEGTTQKDIVPDMDDSTSKLELERRYAEENKKIQKELDLLRKTKASPRGFSAFVLLVFLLSSLLGYLMFGSRA